MTNRKPGSLAMWLQAIVFAVQIIAFSATAEEAVRPFEPGETLTYKLRWKFVNAGTAVFQVQPIAEMHGIPAHHFLLTIRSSSLVDMFYKVRDRVEGYTDLAVTRSLLYTNEQREGSYSRDVTVTFDWQNEMAQFANSGEKQDPIFIYPGTLDPLSVIYHLRMQELVPGNVLKVPATDGKRIVIGRVRVVERQKVKVPAGKFDAFLVEPELGRMGGVVKRSEAAAVQIWISADERQIPLKVSGTAKLGSFSAVLASVE